jgi:ATP-dependent Lhr-like helicase
MLLEAYRECMRDVFDMPAFLEILRAISGRQIRVHVVDSKTPSPFASSLLFSYVANYIYDGDAPLAERRAQALSIDQEQLRDLLGDADLRELLDADAIAEVEEQLQALTETTRARSADGVHDLLLRLGDLSRDELAGRVASPDLLDNLPRLLRARRLLEIKIAGEKRVIAIEDAARYRDALGIPLPPGIPGSLLASVTDPVLELARRFARTHGPFTLQDLTARFALDAATVETALRSLLLDGRIVEGGFRPGGIHREWCDAEVLRLIRRKSLARLRKEIEPVEQKMLARLQTHWLGERDGRIALYLSDNLSTLLPPQFATPGAGEPLTEREHALLKELERGGAAFFAQLHEAVGGGYPGESLDALWSLVWRGLATNDTFHALRAYTAKPSAAKPAKRQHNVAAFRPRRTTPPTAQGRWSLVPRAETAPTPQQQTAWSHAIALQLLNRYGIVTRESAAQENLAGGFSAIYDVLKGLEESGRIRRGYFVDGLGATQFSLPAAVDLLRSLRGNPEPERPELVTIAATDPANPYGSVLRWPSGSEISDDTEQSARSMSRSVGASVVLRNGELVAYLRRNNPNIQVFLPAEEPDRSNAAQDLASFLAANGQREMRLNPADHRGGMLIASINGRPAHEHLLSRYLQDSGFRAAPLGLNLRRILQPVGAAEPVEGPEISRRSSPS